MTTTQITTINIAIAPEYFGDFSGDYDLDGLNSEYRARIQAEAQFIVESIHVAANGNVYADIDDTSKALAIDWDEIIASVDVSDFLDEFEISKETSLYRSGDVVMDVETLDRGVVWVGQDVPTDWVGLHWDGDQAASVVTPESICSFSKKS